MPREKWHCEFEHPAWCITYKQYQPPPASNCKKHMKEQLDEYYHQGVDIILSDEVIGAMFAKQRSDPHYERAKEALHEFEILPRCCPEQQLGSSRVDWIPAIF